MIRYLEYHLTGENNLGDYYNLYCRCTQKGNAVSLSSVGQEISKYGRDSHGVFITCRTSPLAFLSRGQDVI